MTDDDLRADVTAELLWDPNVESREIVVSVQHGLVTLTGAVASLRQKREARKAARRVYGVTSVSDQLKVRKLRERQRDDADVCADVLRALVLDSTIPPTVHAKTDDGLVTLTGAVSFHYQRAEAEFICANVPGVLDISDEVTLIPAPGGDHIEHEIIAALRRSARLAFGALSVDARPDGTVILSGTVTSCPAHDDALAVAWSAPGITEVDDRVIVIY
jgi:osmotically-inducible protein OsmY